MRARVCSQALVAKYMEPARSLGEAARRAWAPVETRTLDWNRRAAKAAAAQEITAAQLLQFYEEYVHPDGCHHAALAAQLWGGVASSPPPQALAATVAADRVCCIDQDGVEALWRSCTLLPEAGMVPPPAAASAVKPAL
jgi:hypothetical protein